VPSALTKDPRKIEIDAIGSLPMGRPRSSESGGVLVGQGVRGEGTSLESDSWPEIRPWWRR
jgi:hypothetical protein